MILSHDGYTGEDVPSQKNQNMPILTECCCGCSLKMGTLLIALYYLIISIESATVVIVISMWENKPEQSSQNVTIPEDLITFVSDHHTELCLSSAFNVFQAIWALCLFIGALMGEAVMLLLWVTSEAVLTVALNIIDIMIIIHLAMILNEMLSHQIETYALVFAIITPVIISLCLTVYLLLVVYSYFQKLCENQGVDRGPS